MYHSPTNDILIFATEDGVKVLAQSNCWCGDGTFKIVPSWYQQLFTLHVFLRGKLLPVVYCLTVRKDLPTYSRIFKCSIPRRKNLAFNLNRRPPCEPIKYKTNQKIYAKLTTNQSEKRHVFDVYSGSTPVYLSYNGAIHVESYNL
ncbi:hypothetical protein T12_113 [Trichinella patagoniensis]|uniref:Uncharacterized protein n=1 Tax=Trichinella patagoniensis TaxID=990121 RepID=A0A0V0Z3Q1_9BILA|nr:hypothetical protein T12_113 [Trichinella patagoniensis]